MYAPPDHYIPQHLVDRRPLAMWFAVTGVVLLFVALIIAAPVALANGHPLLGRTIYQAFSNLCHQLPERSFFIAGHKFAVCARCTGLYIGFATAVLFYPAIRPLRSRETPKRIWLFIAAVPLALDFTLGFSGVWENTHLSRFSTGALLGAVAVFYVMPGLVDLSLRNWAALFHGSKEQEIAPSTTGNLHPDNPSAAKNDYAVPYRRI